MPIPPAQARKLILLVFTAALLSFFLALVNTKDLAGLVFWRIGIASMLIAVFLLLLFPDASFRETRRDE
ncbi:MAG: hypothetical protein EA380_07005 [Phycisphaeraceae bacterium]|nr:MAG: hypothetical protein EA380_07005 [Phycisphaeraceae bacterium]